MEHRPIKKTTRGISLGDSRLGLPEGIIRYAVLLISQSLNPTIHSNSPKLFPDFFFFLASLDLGFTLGRAHSFVADSGLELLVVSELSQCVSGLQKPCPVECWWR